MRFVADGPDIPDDLLLARDQGRVVFFCGAGVSQARAKLPDFFGLAKAVVSSLRVAEDSAAYRLIAAASEIEKQTGITGVVSADRIFGQLERDFLPRDVEASVAAALDPAAGCDLSAHHVLLDLATTPEGIVQLVTTNFDRLFDDCGRNLPLWRPPRLPSLSRPSEMSGIVYLHGRAAADYRQAEGEGFILSSSSFGRAYLSDGWATQFFKDIIQRYVVVFVGYAADDPPVQYLLEALSRTAGQAGNAYAFQSGEAADAAARWQHKGVHAISYDPANGHVALWNTLNAWAERARDIEAWYAGVLAKARAGPEELAPFERGQVAHVVSTYEGTKRLCGISEPLPATWLCVFDRWRRYARPAYMGAFRARGPFVDPFDFFGLDSDEMPKRIDPEDRGAKRDLPAAAWDGFAINRRDREALREVHLAAFRESLSEPEPRLAPRLCQLGEWLSRVAHQPAALWWAARQSSLHRDIQRSIKWRLQREEEDWDPALRQAWLFLFDAWADGRGAAWSDWYELDALIKCGGWDAAAVRRYGSARRPRLEAGFNYWGGPLPPRQISDGDGLLRCEVSYPDRHDDIAIPDSWVGAVAVALRRNLVIAVELENEIGGYGLASIPSIVADPTRGPHDRRIQLTQGLSCLLFDYVALVTRLGELDPSTAREEVASWPRQEDTVFAKLRMWAAGQERILPAAAAEEMFAGLSNRSFWDLSHQRDLLVALAARWHSFSEPGRARIEQKIVEGPERGDGEEQNEFEEWCAICILNRLHWLKAQGATFGFNLQQVTEDQRRRAPRWNPSYADEAAASREGRSGWVRTSTDHASLVTEPLGSLLARAERETGRTEEFLVENDPFAGLAAARPVRALAALMLAAGEGHFPEWAWRTFLNPEARKEDRSRLTFLVASRLLRLPDHALVALLRPISSWVLFASTILSTNHQALFDLVIRKLVVLLQDEPQEGQSALVRGKREPEWVMDAINAPVGKIAQALFNDPRKNGLVAGARLPAAWAELASGLLSLRGNLRRHALSIFFFNLNWFYAVDPAWTESGLMQAIEGSDSDDKDAAWAAFFWSGGVPNGPLYARLKPHLLKEALQIKSSSPRADRATIAGIVLAGWSDVDPANGNKYISDDEMRRVLLNSDDDFRSRVLWQIQNWMNSDESETKERGEQQLVALLTSVWPRQAAVKSGKMSGRLCELAFSSERLFPVIAPLVLSLLARTDSRTFTLHYLQTSQKGIVTRYPDQTLALLEAILPDDTQEWPYGIDTVLTGIAEADEALKTDTRYLSLKRRWDAR